MAEGQITGQIYQLEFGSEYGGPLSELEAQESL